ncbi:hypothetical protein V5O48_018988, partial [Marasmius crinis-equi]
MPSPHSSVVAPPFEGTPTRVARAQSRPIPSDEPVLRSLPDYHISGTSYPHVDAQFQAHPPTPDLIAPQGLSQTSLLRKDPLPEACQTIPVCFKPSKGRHRAGRQRQLMFHVGNEEFNAFKATLGRLEDDIKDVCEMACSEILRVQNEVRFVTSTVTSHPSSNEKYAHQIQRLVNSNADLQKAIQTRECLHEAAMAQCREENAN